MGLKVKQLSSENITGRKSIKSDGNGNVIFSDDIERGISFPTGSSSGDTFYRTDDEMLYYFDGHRGKWLSSFTVTYSMSKTLISGDTSSYLDIGTVSQSSIIGIVMPKNGTITNVTAINSNTIINRSIEIRINNSTVNRVVMPMIGVNMAYLNNANVDFSVGDIIQGYVQLNDIDDMNNLIVSVIVSWRH
jgi:hypothetical protein